MAKIKRKTRYWLFECNCGYKERRSIVEVHKLKSWICKQCGNMQFWKILNV